MARRHVADLCSRLLGLAYDLELLLNNPVSAPFPTGDDLDHTIHRHTLTSALRCQPEKRIRRLSPEGYDYPAWRSGLETIGTSPMVPRDSTSVTTAPVSASVPPAMNAELKPPLASTR